MSSEIDPLVAEILLKGDDEFLSKLTKVAEESASKLEKLSKIKDPFQALTGSVRLLEFAIAGVTAATVAFIDGQTELSQATLLLADSFGVTGEQLQNIEQVFASSGVKVEQFERFAIRLTGTIAREWPQIAESIKTYATENDAAMLRVANATLHVQDAQKALADNWDERSATMSRDNNALEQSYLTLQFAAVHAAQDQVGAAQSVRGAELSTMAAVQALQAARGIPVSSAEKESLAIAQAEHAVDAARKAEADARIAQQEKAANAALKVRQQQQEYDDLARKAAKNARDDAEQAVKDHNAVKEAIIQRAEAEQKAAKLALTNIASIKENLKGLVSGGKDFRSEIDLTEVSVENLKKGVIALAADASKGMPPSGWVALQTLADLFEKDINKTINVQQRLRLVTELSGSAMQTMGKSAAETVHVLENGSEAFKNIAKGALNFRSHLDESRHVIQDYRDKLNQFELTVSQLSQLFAAAIAPAFTVFLEKLNTWFIAIGNSANETGGYIHEFWTGLKAIGSTIGQVGSAIIDVVDVLAKFINLLTGNRLNLDSWALLKGLAVGIGVAIVAWTGPIGIAIVAIGGVVLAIGYVRDHLEEVTKIYEEHKSLIIGLAVFIGIIAASFAPWTVALGLITAGIVLIVENWDGVKAAIDRAWKSVQQNAIYVFLDGVVERIKAAADWWNQLWGSKQAPNPSAGTDTHAVEGPGFAGGGAVDGPGSSTSDSILARLSRGEFVIKAAAVQNYGEGLFHALNNMMLPGFAQGGVVDQSGHNFNAKVGDWAKGRGGDYGTLNLTIDGHTFKGLTGSRSVIDDLSSFATSRQASAAGENPSWMK